MENEHLLGDLFQQPVDNSAWLLDGFYSQIDINHILLYEQTCPEAETPPFCLQSSKDEPVDGQEEQVMEWQASTSTAKTAAPRQRPQGYSALDDESNDDSKANIEDYTIKSLDDAYTKGRNSPSSAHVKPSLNTITTTPIGIQATVVRRAPVKATAPVIISAFLVEFPFKP